MVAQLYWRPVRHQVRPWTAVTQPRAVLVAVGGELAARDGMPAAVRLGGRQAAVVAPSPEREAVTGD